jgi:hypothetical protein
VEVPRPSEGRELCASGFASALLLSEFLLDHAECALTTTLLLDLLPDLTSTSITAEATHCKHGRAVGSPWHPRGPLWLGYFPCYLP